jgi:hypothetical protein
MHHNNNEVGKLRLVATDFSLQVHVKHINLVFATSHSYVILSLNQSIDPGFKYHPLRIYQNLAHTWLVYHSITLEQSLITQNNLAGTCTILQI